MRRTLILLLALGAALTIAACAPSTGGTGTTGTAAGTPAPSADVSTTIHVLDFKLDPAALAVQGTVLSLAVTNDGPTVHNVTVRDASGTVLFGTSDLRAGQSETVVHAIAPGTYALFCSLPGHESLGVKGTLTVAAP